MFWGLKGDKGWPEMLVGVRGGARGGSNGNTRLDMDLFLEQSTTTTGRRFRSGIALIKRQQLLLFSSMVPPNQIYGANNLYAGPAFHSNRDARCSSLLQIRADGREWLTAAGRDELWRVRTCK